MSATLTIGDTTYQVEVEEIEFTHEQDDYYETNCPAGFNRQFNLQEVNLTGEIHSIIVKERDMRYPDEPCEAVCKDTGYDGNSLAKKVKDLSLTEDERLLRKYRVVHEDGTLSPTGIDLLLTTLFEENKQSLVEKLKAVEKAEKE